MIDSFLKSSVEDMRGIVAIIFVIIFMGAFFVAIQDVPVDDSTKENLQQIESNFFLSIEVILIGMGILGSVGFIITIIVILRHTGLI